MGDSSRAAKAGLRLVYSAREPLSGTFTAGRDAAVADA
jgi:hypothetical protein